MRAEGLRATPRPGSTRSLRDCARRRSGCPHYFGHMHPMPGYANEAFPRAEHAIVMADASFWQSHVLKLSGGRLPHTTVQTDDVVGNRLEKDRQGIRRTGFAPSIGSST